MSSDVLSRRALSRATLARQQLLQRESRPVVETVRHLVGLQAQLPQDPYLALWSRTHEFDPDELSRLLVERAVVRIVVMRGTIHLVTGDDAQRVRPLVQPILDRELERHRDHAPALRNVKLAPILAAAGKYLAEPRTGPELKSWLAARFPDHDAAALAYACRNHLALVQVPPRGLWKRSAQVTVVTAKAWLGRPPSAATIDEVALRYFTAFGPATAADFGAWIGLAGMREVIDRLQRDLRPLRDEDGRELYDLPDAPRPDPDVDAPPRFLPEYDNVLLSHADRRRFGTDDDRRRLTIGRPPRGTVLVDGRVAGTWSTEPTAAGGSGDGVALTVRHLRRFPKATRSAVLAEARALVAFLDAGRVEVRLELLP